MSYKVLVSLLIISCIYTHGTVPNVVVFNDKAYAGDKAAIDFKKIVLEFVNSIKSYQPVWNYTDQGFIYDQHMTVFNFNITDVTIQTLNSSKLLDDRQVLSGTNNFFLRFIADFNAKVGIASYVKGNLFLSV